MTILPIGRTADALDVRKPFQRRTTSSLPTQISNPIRQTPLSFRIFPNNNSIPSFYLVYLRLNF